MEGSSNMELATSVPMLRIARKEEVYDREEIFGRDASSVFPTEAAVAKESETNALREALGAGRFITETEVEELRKSGGVSVEDGGVFPDKPLAQVLMEAKEAKEEAFQATWKQMKQGKNRPLDEDEMEFLDGIEERERAAQASMAAHEEQELQEYQLAVLKEQEEAEAEAAAREEAAKKPPQLPQPQPAKPKPKQKPRPVVIVRKAAPKPAPAQEGPSTSAPEDPQGQKTGQSVPEKDAAVLTKRQKVEEESAGGGGGLESGGGGLLGLLGDYGSDEDD